MHNEALLAGLPDRYAVLEHVGSGAFGNVYRAHDRLLERSVALKVMERVGHEDAESVLHEAKALAAVESPYVVRVLDFVPLGTARVVVMEFVGGGSLAQHMERRERMTDRLAMSVCRALARGLADIHAANILHCDLKPANVLLTSAGGARIADFGLARRHDTETSTPAGGSIGYVAPEVLQGAAPTAAADVYSAGVMMWELLSGQRAFPDGPTIRVLGQQLTSTLQSLSSVSPAVPAELRDVIHRSLEVEPDARPTSAMLTSCFEQFTSDSATAERNLRGLGITAVVPFVLMVTVGMVWLTTWAIPSIVDADWGRFRWYRLLVRSGFDEMFDRGGRHAGKAVMLAVASVAGIVAAVANLAALSLQSRVRLIPLLRQLFAAPSWWPTWYPGLTPTEPEQRLPDTIHRFRLMTWWFMPIVSWLGLVVIVCGLARSPMLSIAWVRTVISVWICAACCWGIWLFAIVGRYRHSETYDALEIAEIAIFRRPVADVARALPDIQDLEHEQEQPTVLGSTRLHAWIVRRFSSRLRDRVNAAWATARRATRIFQMVFVCVVLALVGGWFLLDPSVRAGSPTISEVFDRITSRIATTIVRWL